MKKIITILSACLFILSCKKEEKKVCWYCTFGTINGVTPPPKTVCNDGEDPGPFKNEQNNDLNSNCKQQ